MAYGDELLVAEGDGTTLPLLEVRSAYGLHDRVPFVELAVNGAAVPLTTEAALALGAQLIETAMATRADAFVHDFARDELAVDDLAAGVMLRKFRAWRLARATDERARGADRPVREIDASSGPARTRGRSSHG